MAIDDKMIADLQKASEGNALALGAVSEVLQKTEGTISQLGSYVERLLAKADKDEEDEKKKKEEDAEEESFAKLVKALEMVGFVTKDQTSFEHTGADSEEKKKDVPSKPNEQQDVIQGAQDTVEKSILKPENLPKKAGALKKGDEDEKDEKDEKKDEEEYPEVEKLKKDLAKAQEQLGELQKSQDGKIQTAVEGVLSKMGFHREKKSFSPTPTQIGVDQNKIQKSADEPVDRIGELAKLSYADLRKLQVAEEQNQLPPEVRALIV